MNRFEKYILKTYDAETLKELACHGCGSGCAGGLIYTHETNLLFKEYDVEIEELYQEFLDNTGFGYFDLLKNEESVYCIINKIVWIVVEDIADRNRIEEY